MKRLKALLRLICPPILLNIGIWLKVKMAGLTRLDPQSKYSGLENLDQKIERHLDFDNGYFVEIGGWDGVTYSNTIYFEKYRNWRGVLIEPSPINFLKCRENRPLAKVYCYACVPFGYSKDMIRMRYCASMTTAHSEENARNQIEKIDAHVESGIKFLSGSEIVFDFGAIAKPLSNVLNEAAVVRPIDLLVLDVEGFELAVLEGIDFDRHAPKFICVEAWDFGEIKDYLTHKNYIVVEQLSHHDYLFRRSAAN